MMSLEEAFQTTLDESMLAGSKSVQELEDLLRQEAPGAAPAPAPGAAPGGAPPDRDTARPRRPGSGRSEPIQFPSWIRSGPAWLIRSASLPTWILPLSRPFMSIEARGVERRHDVRGPVVFAANHQSRLDTPAILRALPPRWRYRVAPAMAKEFFRAHFTPGAVSRREWFLNSLNYYLASAFFNAFPLPQREAGTRQTLRYIGEVLADDYSVLIFPEGRRSDDGALQPFRPGIGMIGSRLDVPVVPVRITGLTQVLHPKMRWPRRGPVTVNFGAPMTLTGDDYPALAQQVEEAVARL
jgi:long-chain acyl-CoA synthetase